MNTRLLVVLGASAFLCATAAPAATTGFSVDSGVVLVAVCSDGSEWVGAAPATVSTDGSFVVSPLALLDAATISLPAGCEGLLLPEPSSQSPAEPAPSPDVRTQDAAVWSRGGVPTVRASDVP